MIKVEIRKASEGDLPSIVKIWQRNIKTLNTFSDIARLYRYFSRYFFIAVIKEPEPNSGEYDKDKIDNIIGFVAGALRDGHGHVSGLAVERRYRRKGVGSSLLRRLYEEFRNEGFERVTLEVRMSNKDAIRLYEDHGFKPAFIIHGYYADGEDAILYEKRLSRAMGVQEPAPAYTTRAPR